MQPVKPSSSCSKNWQHEGVFGSFDRASAQRGFQVYREVCAACHSLDFIAFRNLQDLGFSEDEVKALAAEYTVIDGPDDEGEMFERPGKPFDQFPPLPERKCCPRRQWGRLSARSLPDHQGAPQRHELRVYSLLLGYSDEPPADVEVGDGMNYNAYYPGHQIAMAQPLYEESVEYADGTEANA